MLFDWEGLGINRRGRFQGEIKTLCPKCSHTRKHKRDLSLSANLTTGLYKCHNGCGFQGTAAQTKGGRMAIWERPRKVYTKPKYKPAPEPAPEEAPIFQWFKNRAIPAELVKEYKIETRIAWMPQSEKEERAIAFPYFRNGELINVKYRTKEKWFKMESGAELMLYGVDDLKDCDTALICEGEIDKLSLHVAGYPNTVSVPNGNQTNLDCLAGDEGALARLNKIILATDNDAAGQILAENLIARFGRDRCWRVEWPDGCKDANDVLRQHGPEALAICIESAKAVPIEGVFEVEDCRDEVKRLYEQGRPTGFATGWDSLTELYRPRLGDMTVLLAIPGAGKTSWMAALMVNMARLHGWVFAVFPAENLPAAEYISMLLEIYTGKPFNGSDQGPERMTPQEREDGLDWLQRHFIILDPGDDDCDLDRLLDLARTYCLRRGIKGLVIDPWNELDHKQPSNQTQTQYISSSLRKIRRFSKSFNIHTFIIVHPTKLTKDKEGNYPVPTLYDADGSAAWRNKCDAGIVLWRNYANDLAPIDVLIQKIRWRWAGRLGKAQLWFDRWSGRYGEQPFVWSLPDEPALIEMTTEEIGAVELVESSQYETPVDDGEGDYTDYNDEVEIGEVPDEHDYDDQAD